MDLNKVIRSISNRKVNSIVILVQNVIIKYFAYSILNKHHWENPENPVNAKRVRFIL